MKRFAKYTLITDAKFADIEASEAIIAKINSDADANVGIWQDRYGLQNIGSITEKGVEYLAVSGQVNGHTKQECAGLLKGIKAELKSSIGLVNKVHDQFVAFGQNIF